MASIKVSGRTDVIKGEIKTGGSILLYNCDIGGQHIDNFQKTTVVITVKSAFWALNLYKKEDMRFEEVRIDFGEIIDWTGLCYFDWEKEKHFYEQKLEWVHENNVEFQISDELSLQIIPHLGSKSRVTTKEITINQTVYMHLLYKKDKHWDEILKDIKVLNSLLTLGMNKAIYIDDVSYYHESNRGVIIPDLIDAATVFLGDCREGKHNEGNWHDYLFDLKALTENDFCCLKNWYAKYDKLRPVVDLYKSAFSYIGISDEMLFLNLTQALETYHARFVSDNYREYQGIVDDFLRQKYKLSLKETFPELAASYRKILIAQDSTKQITLKSRLGDLFLARFDIIFTFLDYGMEEFIQKTLDSRNYFTHYSADKEDKIFTEKELPYVKAILLVVLQYYIMKEIGIDIENIKMRVGQRIGSVNRSYQMVK